MLVLSVLKYSVYLYHEGLTVHIYKHVKHTLIKDNCYKWNAWELFSLFSGVSTVSPFLHLGRRWQWLGHPFLSTFLQLSWTNFCLDIGSSEHMSDRDILCPCSWDVASSQFTTWYQFSLQWSPTHDRCSKNTGWMNEYWSPEECFRGCVLPVSPLIH